MSIELQIASRYELIMNLLSLGLDQLLRGTAGATPFMEFGNPDEHEMLGAFHNIQAKIP